MIVSLLDIMSFLASIKDSVSTLQSLFTITAIIIGSIWTYMIFIRTRQIYPRLKITHQISHYAISHEKIILSLSIVIFNTGSKLIKISRGELHLSQLPSTENLLNLPTGRRVVIWPEITTLLPLEFQCQMEPGEEQPFLFHFVIDSNTLAILAETNFRNNITGMHWRLSTIHYLQEADLEHV